MLQRQIMPLDRDFDVFALYVDPEDARLDADRYEIGGNRAAKDLNNAAIRQSTSTGRTIHPDQIESRTALRVRSGERLSFGTYFNAFPASYWRRWTVVRTSGSPSQVSGRGATVIVYRSLANGRSQRVDSASTGARPRAPSSSTSRSSRSSTAAGTGTTSSPATTTPSSSPPSGPPRSPRTGSTTGLSTSRSPR